MIDQINVSFKPRIYILIYLNSFDNCVNKSNHIIILKSFILNFHFFFVIDLIEQETDNY